MADLFSCVKVIPDAAYATVPYDQVVTGINDARTGVAFTPHTMIILNTVCPINTVYHPMDGGINFNAGIAQGTTYGSANGTGEILGPGPFKHSSGCSLSKYSICTNGPSIFGGGSILDAAYVSAASSGTITITWTLRYTGTAALGMGRVVLFLGGSDWTIDIANQSWNITKTTSAIPAGLVKLFWGGAWGNSFASTVGAGPYQVGIGWATREGDYGCTSSIIGELQTADGGLNTGAQLHDRGFVQTNPDVDPPVITSGTPTISSWGSTSYTGIGSTLDADGATISFGGAGIICKAGDFDAPITDGSVTVNLGIDPYFIIFASGGAPDSTSPTKVQGSTCIGFTDRTHVGSVWCGENSLTFPGGQLHGANFLSNQYLIESAVPAGSSTVIKNKMSLTPITGTDGVIHVSFTDTDGTAPNIIWFAVGIESAPDVFDRGVGIYKLVPDKRQDTIWFDANDGSTYLAKKPNPNAIGALLGDE